MNITEYLQTEFRTFHESEFSAVDSLILSQLSYVLLEEVIEEYGNSRRTVRIKDIYMSEKLDQMLGNILFPKENKGFIIALAGSPRFRDIKIKYYVNEIDEIAEKQFAAVSFILDKKTAYVAFRGTDITFVGWKEDFNMAFMSEVPAQARAVQYLNKVSSKLPKNIIVGGHSKGGNLAVYSAAMCRPQLKKKITAVYSHDGPGFKTLLNTSQYSDIKDKIKKTVPQSSIIGMLLSTQEDYTVVKSKKLGILQHDPFSWEIEDGGFKTVDELSGTSKLADKALTNWLSEMTDEDREKYVELIFKLIKAANVNTLHDLGKIKLKDIKAVADLTSKLDAETKKFLFDTYKKLAVLSIKSLKG